MRVGLPCCTPLPLAVCCYYCYCFNLLLLLHVGMSLLTRGTCGTPSGRESGRAKKQEADSAQEPYCCILMIGLRSDGCKRTPHAGTTRGPMPTSG